MQGNKVGLYLMRSVFPVINQLISFYNEETLNAVVAFMKRFCYQWIVWSLQCGVTSH